MRENEIQELPCQWSNISRELCLIGIGTLADVRVNAFYDAPCHSSVVVKIANTIETRLWATYFLPVMMRWLDHTPESPTSSENRCMRSTRGRKL